MRLKKILATVLTLALMASAAVCIPFTASAEYSGNQPCVSSESDLSSLVGIKGGNESGI